MWFAQTVTEKEQQSNLVGESYLLVVMINLYPCVPEAVRAVSAKDIYAGASPVTDSNF